MMSEESNYWKTVFRRRLSRRTVLAGGLGLAGATIIGCGSSTTTSPEKTGTSGSTPQPSAGTPQRGGTLRYALASDPGSLDPHVSVIGWNQPHLWGIYDPLIGYDKTGAPFAETGLSEKWDITPDGLKITLYLRKGIKFHDGTPFNAQAVKFNYDRILNPDTKSPMRTSLSILQETTVADDYTISLRFSQPRAGILTSLGGPGGFISSPTAIQKWGSDPYGKHPVGTGPFIFDNWVSGSEVTYKPNPEYWRKDKSGNQLPYLDGLKIAIIPDATVSLANLETGDLDIVGVTPQDLDRVKSNKNLSVLTYTGSVWEILIFNTTKKPFDDKNARLAVAHAVNADAINKAVYYGQNIVSKAGLMSPGHWAYEEFPRITFDQNKAKDFLAKAGLAQGFSFQMLTYSTPQKTQAAELIQSQLAELGMKASIEVRENIVANTSFFGESAFPVFSDTWSYVFEPDGHNQGVFKSGAYYNPSKGVKNDSLDQLIDKESATFDIQERKKIITQIQSYVVNEGLYVPYLYSVVNLGYNNKVQNMDTFVGAEKSSRFTEIWLKK